MTGPLFKWNLSWIWRYEPSRLTSLVRGSGLVQSREEWDDGKETNERRLVFFFLCPIFPRTRFISATLLNIIKERSVTSHHHGSKISGSQQSFFAETAAAICIVERWKESMGYLFVPKCNGAQESHPCHFFVSFFLTYLQDRCLLISRNFATMVTWRNNLSSKKIDKREDWRQVRPCKATGPSVRTSKDERFYLIFYRYTGWKINGFWSGHKVDKRTGLPSVTLAHYHGLRKQPTCCETTTGLPVKWRLRNERRNSILMKRHNPDLGSASDWLEQIPYYTWHDQSETLPRSR